MFGRNRKELSVTSTLFSGRNNINEPLTKSKTANKKRRGNLLSLSSAIRHTDFATRYNNSYSIILPETNSIGTQQLTKRLEEMINVISSQRFKHSIPATMYTIRFASATYPDEAENWLKLFHHRSYPLREILTRNKQLWTKHLFYDINFSGRYSAAESGS